MYFLLYKLNVALLSRRESIKTLENITDPILNTVNAMIIVLRLEIDRYIGLPIFSRYLSI